MIIALDGRVNMRYIISEYLHTLPTLTCSSKIIVNLDMCEARIVVGLSAYKHHVVSSYLHSIKAVFDSLALKQPNDIIPIRPAPSTCQVSIVKPCALLSSLLKNFAEFLNICVSN